MRLIVHRFRRFSQMALWKAKSFSHARQICAHLRNLWTDSYSIYRTE